MRVLAAISAALALFCCTPAVRADIFILHTGGEVRGELVNKDQAPRTAYSVRTVAGGVVSLDAKQVKEVKPQSATEIQYEQLRAAAPDTIEGQWKLAEWCFKHRMPKARAVHLQRVVELDPEHAEAHRGLGQVKIQGRWVTQTQHMKKEGFVRHNGAWRYRQEVELLEARRIQQTAEAAWSGRMKRWSNWLRTEKAPQAQAAIAAIQDPYAVRALDNYLHREGSRGVKMLYADALTRIATPAAMESLVSCSMSDGDEEVRLYCLEKIAGAKYTPATKKYVQALKAKENPVVNMAAVALAHMKDPSAIGPLIDALITEHRLTFQQGDPRQMSSTFSTDPTAGGGGFGNGGFSFGNPTKVVDVPVYNRDVLDALVALTGTNFNYDVKAWKYWFAAQKKPSTFNSRRD